MKSQLSAISDSYHYRTTAIYDALLVYLSAHIEASKGNEPIANRLADLDKTLAPHGLTAQQYFRNLLFIQLISEVELHIVEILKAVFTNYPRKLGSVTFRLSEILASPSPKELIERAASIYLNKIMYEKPMDYLKELAKVLSFDEALLDNNWPQYVEAKARRDVGVHDNWRSNKTYIRKIAEAGMTTNSTPIGSSLFPDSAYIMGCVNNTDEMIRKIVDHCSEKFSKQEVTD